MNSALDMAILHLDYAAYSLNIAAYHLDDAGEDGADDLREMGRATEQLVEVLRKRKEAK